MIKRIFILFFLCTPFLLKAEDSLRVEVANQYKQGVKNADININGILFHTDAKSFVTLPIKGDEQLQITLKNFDTASLSRSEVLKEKRMVLQKQFTWTDLLTPMFYILAGGIWLLLIIIFAETGLFIGFFFPGDSLLFVAGILSTPLVESISLNTNNDFFNLLIISSLCTIAGILGNTVGYLTGKKVGPAMFNWRDRLLFKKKYLYQAQEFYDKHGGAAIIFARFLPFVRTFAPIVAGIVGMDRKKFGFFNIIGCIAWVCSMLFAGHYLNEFCKRQFGLDLEKHLEAIVIIIVAVTTAPVIIRFLFRKSKAAA
jgi:membrane-associated protein